MLDEHRFGTMSHHGAQRKRHLGQAAASPRLASAPANIFVVGLDEFNGRKLEKIAEDGSYSFHPLLSIEEVTAGRGWSLEKALDKAMRLMEAVPGRADAIIGYWDFPVSLLVPILCRRLSLTSPTLESVLKCEHKYWSRMEQRRIVPEHTPPFQAVDPFDDDSIAGIHLEYPFWFKPVKSFASHLGFRIGNSRDLRGAIGPIRRHIRELGDPFNQFLGRADVPPDIAAIDGNHCIAEGIASGRQCTLEGFVYRGTAEIYGVVDSIRHANRSTFARYEYPSLLPRDVKESMAAIAEKVVGKIGFDNGPFNIEFFWDAQRQKISLVEINPRISQSHGDLFEKVDGVPHHKVLADLALGRRPQWRRGGGEFRCAGKFFLRRFENSVVTRVPSGDEIAAVLRELPGTLVEITVEEGMTLAELEPQEQDSYSYIYARLFIGADNRRQLMRNYRRCIEMLRFGFAQSEASSGPSVQVRQTSQSGAG